jgi:hypothetical protein
MRDFQQVGSASISLFAAEEPPRGVWAVRIRLENVRSSGFDLMITIPELASVLSLLQTVQGRKKKPVVTAIL